MTDQCEEKTIKEHVKKVDHTIWKVTSISLIAFLIGVGGAGAFGRFQQSALEIRVEQLELANGVVSQRLTENERQAIAQENHIESVDKMLQEAREKLALQQRYLNQQR